MTKFYDRTIKFYITTVRDRATWHLPNQPALAHGALWREIHARRDRERGFRNEDAAWGTFVQLYGTGNIVQGRVYRDKFGDFPSVGEPDDVDQPLNLSPKQSLRHPAHFAWWDLSVFASRAGTAEPIGLLAFEVAHGAPSAASLEDIIALAPTPFGYVLEVQPFIFKEQWEFLRRNPNVRGLTVRIGADNVAMPDKFGDFVTDTLVDLGRIDLNLKPVRGHALGIAEWLTPLKSYTDSKDKRLAGAAVTLIDGRTWDLAEPHFGLRIKVPKAAGAGKAIDRSSLLSILMEQVAGFREEFGRQLNRQWT